MVLRKPYALFIKYFKLLHFVIAFLVVFLIYNTYVTASFFSEYTKDYTLFVNDVNISSYFNSLSFLIIFLIISLLAMVLSVLRIKKKPYKLYLIQLIFFIILTVFLAMSSSIIKAADTSLLDTLQTAVFRDVSFIAIALEAASLIIIIIRGSGFNLQKFDFDSDLKDLEIEEKDNEEFEVNVKLDTRETTRTIKSRFRNGKYVYLENKLIFNTIIIIVLLTVSFFSINNYLKYRNNVNTNELFTSSGVSMSILDSYITDSNPKGTKITSSEDYSVLVVKVKMKNSGLKVFNTGTATVKVGRHGYSMKDEYYAYLYDFGTGYTDQELGSDYQYYYMAYEIPTSAISNTMYLKVNDLNSFISGNVGLKNNYVKLKPNNLKKKETVNSAKLNETLNLNDSIFGNSTINITSMQIQNNFKLSYDFCYSTDKCFKSYEYVTPEATTNYDKAILKLNGTFIKGDDVKVDKISNLYSLISFYGTLKYTINNKTYKEVMPFNRLMPTNVNENNTYYIEIEKNIINSDSIYFEFNIRNRIYNYYIK